MEGAKRPLPGGSANIRRISLCVRGPEELVKYPYNTISRPCAGIGAGGESLRGGVARKETGMVSKVRPVPQGYEAAIPALVVCDAAGPIEFYKQAFGANATMPLQTPVLHTPH